MNTIRWTILATILTIAAPTALARNGLDTHVEATADLAVDARARGRTDLDYTWHWGDGQTSTGATARHEYRTPGHYRVLVTATDEDGREWTRTHRIHIRPAAPEWNVETDGAEVQARIHTDRSARVVWHWGDGTTSRGARATHHYETGGEYEIAVKVTHRDGHTWTERRTVTIEHGHEDEEHEHDRGADITLRAPALSVEIEAGHKREREERHHARVHSDTRMHVHSTERRDAPGAAVPLVLGAVGAIGAALRRR